MKNLRGFGPRCIAEHRPSRPVPGAASEEHRRRINGAHIIIDSRDAEADREFLRDVLDFAPVDAGDGWLVFKVPPAEFAGPVADQGWGLLVSIVLPGGGQMGLYQPRHPTAFDR